MNKKKLFHHWSSGKDAALSLYKLRQDPAYSVDLLVTTVTMPQNRVSMHGVRRNLLERQFQSIGTPGLIIELPGMPDNDRYDSIMKYHLTLLQKRHFDCAGFGDILLEDVKKYREEQLLPFGMKGVFPLWQKDTRQVMEEFLEAGFKAIIVSVNASLLDKSFCGRIIDKAVINELPEDVDACGENGEFHTFCFDGPIFHQPLLFKTGEKVYKEYKAPETEANGTDIKDQENTIGFWFCDLIAE